MADKLPLDALFHIFSRLPVKSLARFRCVSKLWGKYIDDPYLATIHEKLAMEEPMLLLMHKGVKRDNMPRIQKMNFPHMKSKQSFLRRLQKGVFNEAHIALEVRKNPNAEYSYISFIWRPIDTFLGSCKGLLLLGSIQDYDYWMKNIVVVHPLRKEIYELPTIDFVQGFVHFKFQVMSCGLGFDTCTNTFKVVCVALQEGAHRWLLRPDWKKGYLRTMVHVLRTNTWKEIKQVPDYQLWTEAGVFVNGWLHWLGNDLLTTKIIFFDVKSEEFGFIDPPKQLAWDHDHLVDLCGELGYVYQTPDLDTEVWVLTKNKEWVMYCQFRNEPPLPRSCLIVLGCWNKDGDIILTTNKRRKKRLFVYNLKSGTLRKAGRRDGHVDIQMYRGSLFSIHDAYSIKC